MGDARVVRTPDEEDEVNSGLSPREDDDDACPGVGGMGRPVGRGEVDYDSNEGRALHYLVFANGWMTPRQWRGVTRRLFRGMFRPCQVAWKTLPDPLLF